MNDQYVIENSCHWLYLPHTLVIVTQHSTVSMLEIVSVF